MKDLILNKEEFVRLGLQTITELNSDEFNKLLKDVEKVKKYVYHSPKKYRDDNIKNNY